MLESLFNKKVKEFHELHMGSMAMETFINRFLDLLHYVLLRREIPMAWGTTTDKFTPKINPFLYARETKHLTLKYFNLYVIPDG